MKPAASLARVGLGPEGFSEEEVMVEACTLRQEKAMLIHFPLQIGAGRAPPMPSH